MTIVKEELNGMLTLSFGVDPIVVGPLAPHTPEHSFSMAAMRSAIVTGPSS